MSEVATNPKDIQKYIEATYRQVLNDVDVEAAETAKTKTIKARKAALAKAIKTLDFDTLEQVEKVLTEYVANIATITPEARALTPSEVLTLAEEYERFLTGSEFLAVRRETIKEIFFGHFDTVNGPNTNGEYEVPETGKVFKREGAGRTDPQVDVDSLRDALLVHPSLKVSDVFETVEVPEQIIPAHTEEVFTEEALIKAAARHPELLDVIATVLVPGKQKVEKFVVRPISDKK